MEAYLRSLGLEGDIPKYANLLRAAGFARPGELLAAGPSMQELLGFGIDSFEDIKRIYLSLNPEAAAFLKENEDPAPVQEDTTYGLGAYNEELPEDPYEAYALMKEQLEQMQHQKSSASGDEYDELMRLKDEYARMLGQSSTGNVQTDNYGGESELGYDDALEEYNSLKSQLQTLQGQQGFAEEPELDEYEAAQEELRKVREEYATMQSRPQDNYRGQQQQQNYGGEDEFEKTRLALEQMKLDYERIMQGDKTLDFINDAEVDDVLSGMYSNKQSTTSVQSGGRGAQTTAKPVTQGSRPQLAMATAVGAAGRARVGGQPANQPMGQPTGQPAGRARNQVSDPRNPPLPTGVRSPANAPVNNQPQGGIRSSSPATTSPVRPASQQPAAGVRPGMANQTAGRGGPASPSANANRPGVPGTATYTANTQQNQQQLQQQQMQQQQQQQRIPVRAVSTPATGLAKPTNTVTATTTATGVPASPGTPGRVGGAGRGYPTIISPRSPTAAATTTGGMASPRQGGVQPVQPVGNQGIEGVKLVEMDQSTKVQLEALRALAQKGVPTFGNDIKIECTDPVQVGKGNTERTLYLVSLTTNMKQFSHLTFHRLQVRRGYNHFEELFKKLQSSCNYNLPKFPKKDLIGRFSKQTINERMVYFQMLMDHIAKDPGLNQLSCVVDFFDDTKFADLKDLRAVAKKQ